jgi:hypothetical protein
MLHPTPCVVQCKSFTDFCCLPVTFPRPSLTFVSPIFLLLHTVWYFSSVADPACYPGSAFFPSRIPDPNFFQPGFRILIFSIPDPGSASKYFNPEKWFLSTQKYNPGFSQGWKKPGFFKKNPAQWFFFVFFVFFLGFLGFFGFFWVFLPRREGF